MESVSKLIVYAMTIGITLAGMGKLPQATRWMAEQAMSARPQMISLGRLNRSLQSGGVAHRRHHLKK